jgi:ABC-type branched-subunit amino acid transport system substrate-binding protein
MPSKITSTFLLLIFLINIAHAEDTLKHRVTRIGVSVPLTGDLVEYGSAVKNGIELAKLESPESFKGLSFVYEDNQYEASKAVTAFNKLKNFDKVDLIFNWGEPTLGAIAPIAEQQKFPVLAMSLDQKPAEGNEFVLLTINYAEQYAQKLTQYLRSKGLKRIGILQTEDPFLNSMVDGIRLNLKDGESVEVFATFKPGDADFKTQIARLKHASFDVIGVYLFSGQVSTFFRQASSMKFKTHFFGTDFFESRTEITQSNGGMEGAVYPNLKIPEEFSRKYLEKHGNDAQVAYAYNAYEFARTSALVFPEPITPLSSEAIIPRYLKVTRKDIFTMEKTPEGANYFNYPLVMRMVKGNGFVDVE